MKNVFYLVLVLALAAPVMADVAITMDTDGVISCATTGGAVVRGIGLLVELPDGTTASITAASTKGDAALNAPMDYFYSQVDASLPVVIGEGHPYANPIAKGVATLPATSVSICVGALDESGAKGGIGTGGDATVVVANLDVDCGDEAEVVVTITEDNDIVNAGKGIIPRGGIVGDTLGTVTVSGNTISCAPACDWPCLAEGDLDKSGDISFGDIQIVLDNWTDWSETNPLYEPCADLDGSTDISFGDIQVILDNWTTGCPD